MRRFKPYYGFAVLAVAFAAWVLFALSEIAAPETGNDGLTGFVTRLTTDPVSLFTLFLVVFTGLQGWSAYRQEGHFKATERAYVKMSHVEPGITFRERGGISFNVQIKNWGSTPARVTDAVVCLVHAEGSPRKWPPKPVYIKDDNHAESKAFLVRDDYFFIPREFDEEALPEGKLKKIKAGDAALLVFGYVRYIDAFDQAHQAGYGRWYDYRRDLPKAGVTLEEWKKRSNLAFIQSDEYNYDRLI
jgi:hypothetical protein